MARDVLDTILERRAAELLADRDTVFKAVQEIILDELMVEDRLNQEVREFLKPLEARIERERLDYREMFEITKKKFVRDRKLVL